jgi:hypothetical protein
MSWAIHPAGAGRPLRLRFATRAEAVDYCLSRYPDVVWEVVPSEDAVTHTLVRNELWTVGLPKEKS